MSIWDHEAFSIERKSNDEGLPISVHRPCLSVFGTTQPDVLRGLVRGSQNGFIERILFSYPDDSDEPRKWTWDGTAYDARMAWEMVLRPLYAVDWATPPMEEADSPEGTVWPKFAEFEQEGRLAWENFYGAHQDAREDLPNAMRACHAKLESYAARLALLVALLSMANVDRCTPDRVPVVSKGAVECAALLVRYFMSHACKAYGCLEETAEDKRIDRVVARIKGRGGVVTLRDLVNYKVGGVKCVSAAELLLEKSVDHGPDGVPGPPPWATSGTFSRSGCGRHSPRQCVSSRLDKIAGGTVARVEASEGVQWRSMRDNNSLFKST
jgi:hypothetical protein